MVQFNTLFGLSDYLDTIKLMEEHVNSIIDGSKPEAVYLVEHSEVYTAGTSYRQDELINPGNIYDFQENCNIRISYSYASLPDLEFGLKKLSDIIRKL